MAQHVLEQFSQVNTWHSYTNTLPVASPWVTAPEMFAGGQVLFRTSVFSAIKKLRKYDDGIEFGIVPLPKYDENQENYYSPSDSAYYETTLKHLDTRDDESEVMLDLIFDNKKFDIGANYNFGGLADMFSQLASAGSSDIVSEFESISNTVD